MINQIRARRAARKNQGQPGGGNSGAGIGNGAPRPRAAETDVYGSDNKKLEGGKQSGGQVLSYKQFLGSGQRPTEILTKLGEATKSESSKASESMEMENVPLAQQQVVKEYYNSLNAGTPAVPGGK